MYFQYVPQLHVLARPYGAFFRLKFFKRVICTIDSATLITRSRITLFKNTEVKIQCTTTIKILRM